MKRGHNVKAFRLTHFLLKHFLMVLKWVYPLTRTTIALYAHSHPDGTLISMQVRVSSHVLVRGKKRLHSTATNHK